MQMENALCNLYCKKRRVFASSWSWILSDLIPHQKSDNREATASGLWIKRKETKTKAAKKYVDTDTRSERI